jgi:hypothetical protein
VLISHSVNVAAGLNAVLPVTCFEVCQAELVRLVSLASKH